MPGLPPPARPIAHVPPVELPGLSGLLTLAVSVVVVAALYIGREVMIPITLAVLLSFVLAPLVGLLRRVRLWRVPAVLIAVALALGVIAALSGLIGLQVASLATDMPRYADTIHAKLDTVRGLTVGRVSTLLSDFGRDMAPPAPPKPKPVTKPGPAAAKPAAQPAKPLPVEVRQPALTPLQLMERIATPVLGPLSTIGIVFIVATFILLQQEDLRDRMIRLFGSDDLHRTTGAMDEAGRRLSRYFLTQLGLNAAFGAIIGIGLAVIGVPNPLLWGILAALFRFVPYIGAVLSGLVPLVLAAAVDPGWGMVVWTAALFLTSEAVMGQLVEPMVYGHSTGLSPVSVVVSAIFWGWLWGPVGLILSMPLTLCLVVLGRHVKRLEFIDVLLGDRPALTPVESFYQRMLAGDPDEAQDYAEILLKDRALSSYYDEVALKGLQLAAADAARGVLTAEQLARIHEAMDELIAELDTYDDVDPPAADDRGERETTDAERALPHEPAPASVPHEAPALAPAWRGAAPVLCVAGRGPLDAAMAAMLVQLLAKHGLGARMLPSTAFSRGEIGLLDATDVAMVCICALEIEDSPTHLRYLLRRVRQAVPRARFLIGLWPSGAADSQQDRLRAALPADWYSGSLREAVGVCVAEASSPAALQAA